MRFHGAKELVKVACMRNHARFPAAGIITALYLAGCATLAPDDAGRLTAAVPDLTAYALIHTDGGMMEPTLTTVVKAAETLSGYDVVFVGEAHRHPGNHLAEMALFRAIHERVGAVTLSMEQFERDVQAVVDEYLAGKIGETPFIDKSRAWDNYATSYRPLVEYAKEHHLPVVAANAPEMVVRCVGREGPAFLARMKPEQRGWAAAALHLENGPYRDKFLGFVGGDAGHGGDPGADKAATARPPSESALRSFAAQVTRDDTMAESIAHHLQANPGRKVIHINGAFHSDSFLGTVERLKLRMPGLKIAVVNPVEPEDVARPALTTADGKTGTFVLMLRPLPEPYATDEEMKAAVTKQLAARTKTRCEM